MNSARSSRLPIRTEAAWTPILSEGSWSLPTALNLAAFSALAYASPEGPGAAPRVLEALRRRTAQPRRFGKLNTRLVLRDRKSVV